MGTLNKYDMLWLYKEAQLGAGYIIFAPEWPRYIDVLHTTDETLAQHIVRLHNQYLIQKQEKEDAEERLYNEASSEG